MLALLYGALGVILESIGGVSQKKALSSALNLTQTLFKLFAYSLGLILFITLMLFFPFNTDILSDKIVLLYVFLISLFTISFQNLELFIIKKEKLSTLMPYENIDKIFVVFFGFFIYKGTENEVSGLTMFIVCLAFFIVLLFSINFKTLRFPISVLYYIGTKIIKGLLILLSGYVLLSYVSTTFGFMQTVFSIMISIVISYLLKHSFSSLINQSGGFYKHRFIAVLTGQISFILGLLIIESAGVIIASLLGFLSIIAKTVSIKLLLNENPTYKQITLSFIVVLLIGLGLYFK